MTEGLGEALDFILDRRGVSTKALAAKAGVDGARVDRIRIRNGVPTFREAACIAGALDLRLSELWPLDIFEAPQLQTDTNETERTYEQACMHLDLWLRERQITSTHIATVAEAIGSHSQVSRLRNGHRNVSLETATEIAMAVGDITGRAVFLEHFGFRPEMFGKPTTTGDAVAANDQTTEAARA